MQCKHKNSRNKRKNHHSINKPLINNVTVLSKIETWKTRGGCNAHFCTITYGQKKREPAGCFLLSHFKYKEIKLAESGFVLFLLWEYTGKTDFRYEAEKKNANCFDWIIQITERGSLVCCLCYEQTLRFLQNHI